MGGGPSCMGSGGSGFSGLLTFGLFKRLIGSFCCVASRWGCQKLLWLCQRGQSRVIRGRT